MDKQKSNPNSKNSFQFEKKKNSLFAENINCKGGIFAESDVENLACEEILYKFWQGLFSKILAIFLYKCGHAVKLQEIFKILRLSLLII